MTLLEFIKAIELQRFHMGMGVVEFAQYLGMHYHTYNSFRTMKRNPLSKSWKILLDFAQNKGIDTSDLKLD
jgi:hypothetical protein